MTVGARYSYKIADAERLEDPAAANIVPLPPDLPPEEILDYLVDRFGKPTESAVEDTEEFGVLAIGWVFTDPATSKNKKPREVIIIPMIQIDGETDGPVSMFFYQEQLRAVFTAMAADLGTEVETVHLTSKRKRQ